MSHDFWGCGKYPKEGPISVSKSHQDFTPSPLPTADRSSAKAAMGTVVIVFSAPLSIFFIQEMT